MMKKLMSLAAALILFLSAGCGAAGTDDNAPEGVRLAGSYKLIELYDNNGASMTEKITELEKLGRTITLVLNEDGTGTYQMFDETQTVSWTETDITMEGQTIPMEWNGQTLTILSSDEAQGKMVFTPVSTE